MRILHITNAYPYCEYKSYGIFVKEQIDSLQESGIVNNVIFINARKFGIKEYFRKIKVIKNELSLNNPDIIHCHHEFTLIPLLFIISKRPILLSILGDMQHRTFINKLVYHILKYKAKGVIIKNKLTERKGYYYLPNGVNLNFFNEIDKKFAKNKINLDENKDYALFVTASLNNPIKRYDKFCDVLNLLNKREGLNIQPLILSGIMRDLVPYYFNASKFLLLTSDHEGSPNSIKEAMACNLPVVSTNVGNVKILFGNTQGLFLSEKANIDDLTSKCKIACNMTNSNGRARLIEIGLDIKSIAAELLEIYYKLLK